MSWRRNGFATLLIGSLMLLAGCGRGTPVLEPSGEFVTFPAYNVEFSIPAGWHQSNLKDVRTDIFAGPAQAHNDKFTKDNPDRSCFLVNTDFPAVMFVVPGTDFVMDNPAEARSHVKRGIESGRSAAFLAWLLFGRPPLHGTEFSLQQEEVAGQSLPASQMTGDGVVLWGVHVPKKAFKQFIPVTVGIACRPESLSKAKIEAASVLATINRPQKHAPPSNSGFAERTSAASIATTQMQHGSQATYGGSDTDSIRDKDVAPWLADDESALLGPFLAFLISGDSQQVVGAAIPTNATLFPVYPEELTSTELDAVLAHKWNKRVGIQPLPGEVAVVYDIYTPRVSQRFFRFSAAEMQIAELTPNSAKTSWGITRKGSVVMFADL